MRRVEEMFRRLVEPHQAAINPQNNSAQLQGGGPTSQQQNQAARANDQERQDRERSPRRDENQTS